MCMCIVREEEKRRLMRRNNELKKECAHLKEEDQRLNKSLLVQFMFLYLHTSEAQTPCRFYRDTQRKNECLSVITVMVRLVSEIPQH